MTSKSRTRDHITALFTSFAGQDNMLVIPRAYITFCKGDHLAALLLSQILYWSDRTNDANGWFAHSYQEWEDELGMTEYQVKRAVNGDKRRKNPGFSLKSIGVETRLFQSPYHQGAATLHYRVDKEKLRESVIAFLSDLNNVQNGPQTMFRTGPEQCSERSTETISETISEDSAPSGADAPASHSDETPSTSGADVVASDSVVAGNDTPAPDVAGKKPVQPHVAIIDAWYDGQPAPPIHRKYKRNVVVAVRIMDAGYTPEQVRAFVEDRYRDPWWQDKTLTLEKVEEGLPTWVKANEAQRRKKAERTASTFTPEEIAAQREAQFGPMPLRKAV